MSELPRDAELERFVRGLTCPKEPCRPDPEFPESAYSGPLARARAAALARGLAVREEERAQVETRFWSWRSFQATKASTRRRSTA